MSKISIYIIAFNEIEKVSATIQSALWADEILLVDSQSTDGTPELAASLGAKVVQVEFKGFGDLRNQAIAACSHEWIFSLDADERCTEGVASEIRHIMADPNSVDVYRVPRRNFFMGHWIQHSGWYPNYRQPQLFRRGCMSYDAKAVHEGYLVNSAKPISQIKNCIWQVPFKNMTEVIRKIDRYSTLGAPRVAKQSLTIGTAFFHAVWTFVKHYVFKLGFLDGWAGFVIALQSFEGTFYRYVKAVEIEKGADWQAPRQLPDNL